jgi:hypothetical protein
MNKTMVKAKAWPPIRENAGTKSRKKYPRGWYVKSAMIRAMYKLKIHISSRPIPCKAPQTAPTSRIRINK